MPWKRFRVPRDDDSSIKKKLRLDESTPKRSDDGSFTSGTREFFAVKNATHSPRESFTKKVKVVRSMNILTNKVSDLRSDMNTTFRPIGLEEREERDSISHTGRRCPVFKSIIRRSDGTSSNIIPEQDAGGLSSSLFCPVLPVAMRRSLDLSGSKEKSDEKHIRTIDEIERMTIRCVANSDEIKKLSVRCASDSPTRMLRSPVFGRSNNDEKRKTSSLEDFRSSSW